MRSSASRSSANAWLQIHSLAAACVVIFSPFASNAQLIEVPFGGLKQRNSDLQQLGFTKTVSAASVGFGAGVEADASAEFSLSNGIITGSGAVGSPGGVITSQLGVTGFTAEGVSALGTGEISVSTTMTAAQAVEGQLVGGAAATNFSLIRTVSSNSPAFVNSFASQFR